MWAAIILTPKKIILRSKKLFHKRSSKYIQVWYYFEDFILRNTELDFYWNIRFGKYDFFSSDFFLGHVARTFFLCMIVWLLVISSGQLFEIRANNIVFRSIPNCSFLSLPLPSLHVNAPPPHAAPVPPLARPTTALVPRATPAPPRRYVAACFAHRCLRALLLHAPLPAPCHRPCRRLAGEEADRSPFNILNSKFHASNFKISSVQFQHFSTFWSLNIEHV